MKSQEKSVRVLFLDRDGVINVAPPRGEYITSWKQFRFLPGAIDVLSTACTLGYTLIIVTNQQAIGKGLLNNADLTRLHRRMISALRKHGVEIKALYYCPHLVQDFCSCRKPNAGMLEMAEAGLRAAIDRKRSLIIGDSPSDILAGLRFGIRGIRVSSETAESDDSYPAYVVRDMRDIIAVLRRESVALRSISATIACRGR